MIENLKKYLVVGTFRNANPTIPKDYVQQLIGPYAEEVWAANESMAENEWIRKVLKPGIYAQIYEVEVKEL